MFAVQIGVGCALIEAALWAGRHVPSLSRMRSWDWRQAAAIPDLIHHQMKVGMAYFHWQ